MSKDRPHWISFIARFTAIGVILSIGVVVAMVLTRTAPQPKTADPERQLQSATVFTAQQVEVRRQWSGFGTAQPLDSIDIPARIAATVKTLNTSIRAGQFVKAGSTIATLDATDFERQFEVADERLKEVASQKAQLTIEATRLAERLKLEQDDLEIAQSELANVQMRVDKGAANVRELDAPKRGVIAAKRAIILTKEAIDRIPQRRSLLEATERGLTSAKKLAKLSVDRAIITSPIDGIIEAVDVEVGESVQIGQRVARVVDLRNIEVPLQLPASARQDIVIGSKVTISKSQDIPVTWEGTIARILPTDDQQSRSTVVLIEINQKYANETFGKVGGRNLLTPGTFVTGTADSATTQTRWVVPRRSIINQRLWIIQDDMVKSMPVKREFLHEGRFPQLKLPDDQWAVLSDETPLKPGTRVIVNASVTVSEGQKIRPVDAKVINKAQGERDGDDQATDDQKTGALGSGATR